MLSEHLPSSPLPLRLPPPAPAPEPPAQLPSSESESDGSESDSSESDSEPSVDEEDGESNDDFVTLEPLPLSDDDESFTERPVYDAEKEWLSPIFPDEEIGDKACWERYFQQIDESDGFDIKDYPGCGPMTTIFPMPVFDYMKDYASQALQLYNKETGTNYEFDEIVKANAECTQYYIFYLTFTAMENGEKKYFQAKVEQDVDQSLEFPLVRPRVKGDLDI